MSKISHIQPDAPRLAKTPLELLEPRPNHVEPLITKYGLPAVGVVMGGVAMGLFNSLAKRPLHAGIYKYPIAMAVCGYVTYQVQCYREKAWAEKDAILRDYISLHPEDFPPYPTTKIGQLFETWIPVR